MKKIIAAAAAVAIAVGIFGGCAERPAGEPPSSEAENKRQEETELLLDKDYNTLQKILILGYETPDGENIGEIKGSEDGSPCGYITLGAADAAINLRGWAATDLSAYLPNGVVSLEARGKEGSFFNVGFEEFINGQSAVTKINTDGKVAVTGEWTSFEIPVKDIFADSGNDLSHARKFVIGGVQGEVDVRNISLSSPDRERSFPAIKVNQIGYFPQGEKRALVSGFPDEIKIRSGDTFELADAESGKTVYKGKLELISNYDLIYSGERIMSADFSEFADEGKYFIRIKDHPETEQSPAFVISQNAYDDLLKNTMRYFYYQRANCEITKQYGGEFTRQDQTPKDFDAPLYSDSSTKIDVSGGWYDAGDVGKYVAPGATAANTLLWAYKLFPEKFSDGQNNIPESGNGMPDILDEIRYELDFFLKMQDKESGGFYLKVKSKSEHDEDGDRTVWQGDGEKCLTNATADCTAVLSFASTIYKDLNIEYSEKLLSAAKRGWEYIEKNPDVYTETNYSGSKNNSSSLWAAACMFYATGDEKYGEYIKAHASENFGYMKSGAYCHSVSSMAIYGFFAYMLCENKDAELACEIAEKYSDWKSSIMQKYETNPWGISIDSSSFWWGSFNMILGNTQDMYIGDSVIGADNGSEDSKKLARRASDFILGANAMRKCFITGMGEDGISCTFSNFWSRLPDGYMPGGINDQNGNIISRFPIKSYADEPADWFTNENAIYWNAVMVFNTALNM